MVKNNKYENGGMIMSEKEVEQKKVINKLSIACLEMDRIMKKFFPNRKQNPPINSPAYYLKEAITTIQQNQINQ